MWSIYDNENHRYLESGKNSPDKKTAIDSLTSLLEPELEPEFLTEPDWSKVEEYLNWGFEITQHNEKIP